VSAHRTPRQWLAIIALSELPTPTRVGFHNAEGDRPLINLDFASVADGEAWARHFDAYEEGWIRNGVRYLGQRSVKVQGVVREPPRG
jgi:hypothetical protein